MESSERTPARLSYMACSRSGDRSATSTWPALTTKTICVPAFGERRCWSKRRSPRRPAPPPRRAPRRPRAARRRPRNGRHLAGIGGMPRASGASPPSTSSAAACASSFSRSAIWNRPPQERGRRRGAALERVGAVLVHRAPLRLQLGVLPEIRPTAKRSRRASAREHKGPAATACAATPEVAPLVAAGRRHLDGGRGRRRQGEACTCRTSPATRWRSGDWMASLSLFSDREIKSPVEAVRQIDADATGSIGRRGEDAATAAARRDQRRCPRRCRIAATFQAKEHKSAGHAVVQRLRRGALRLRTPAACIRPGEAQARVQGLRALTATASSAWSTSSVITAPAAARRHRRGQEAAHAHPRRGLPRGRPGPGVHAVVRECRCTVAPRHAVEAHEATPTFLAAMEGGGLRSKPGGRIDPRRRPPENAQLPPRRVFYD